MITAKEITNPAVPNATIRYSMKFFTISDRLKNTCHDSSIIVRAPTATKKSTSCFAVILNTETITPSIAKIRYTDVFRFAGVYKPMNATKNIATNAIVPAVILLFSERFFLVTLLAFLAITLFLCVCI